MRSLSTLPSSKRSFSDLAKGLNRFDLFKIEKILLLTVLFKSCIGSEKSYFENSELVSAASFMIPIKKA